MPALRWDTHKDNAAKIDMMCDHPLYQLYPAKGFPNLGAQEGYFENLVVYCGMAYDSKDDLEPLLSTSQDDSLLVWSEETMGELKKRNGNLRRLQLDAVAYLWEICYNLILAKNANGICQPWIRETWIESQ